MGFAKKQIKFLRQKYPERSCYDKNILKRSYKKQFYGKDIT